MEKEEGLEIFHKTGEELKQVIKKVKILPIVSYFSSVIFLGIVIDKLSNLGNLSYIISVIILPVVGAIIDWFSDSDLLKIFRKEWSNAPLEFHILVIINIFIYYHFMNAVKGEVKSELKKLGLIK